MDGVSVVICCFNSSSRLNHTINCLNSQVETTGIQWEVIIVDNASTDNTVEVARNEWIREDVELRIIDEPKPGLSNARKKGLDSANFSFVSFIDDDNWVENLWVNKVYNRMKSNPAIGILGGKGKPVFEKEKPPWFDKDQRAFAVGEQSLQSGKVNHELYGAGLSVRLQAWRNLVESGFDFLLSDRKGIVITSGGDTEICLAVLLSGYDVYYDDSLNFFHFIPGQRLNWKYLVRLYSSFGRSAPIIHIYRSFLPNTPKSKQTMLQNRWVKLFRFTYGFLLIIPGLIKNIVSNKECDDSILKYSYAKAALSEMIREFWRFPHIVKKIAHSNWIKKDFVDQ